MLRGWQKAIRKVWELVWLSRSLSAGLMCSLTAWAATNDIDSVAMPKIGAGLGKLDWVSDVKPMYEEYLASSKCLFVVYEDYVVQRDA